MKKRIWELDALRGLWILLMILIHLYRLSYEWEEAGYAVTAAPVRISDGWIVAGIVGVLAAGLLVGQMCFSVYPMEWTVAETPDAALVQDVAQIKENLLSLGFPETVLEDLSQEDILACRDAGFVFAETEEEIFSETRFIARERQRKLEVITVAVQLPGDLVRYRFFHYYRWPDDGEMLQREVIEIGPAYNEDGMWALTTDCVAVAIYNQGTAVYRSPMYGMKESQYQAGDWFGGSYERTKLRAGVSYPAENASQCRGYLTYEAVALQEEWRILATTYYYHQTHWFQYPFQSKLKHSFSRLDGVAETVRRWEMGLQ